MALRLVLELPNKNAHHPTPLKLTGSLTGSLTTSLTASLTAKVTAKAIANLITNLRAMLRSHGACGPLFHAKNYANAAGLYERKCQCEHVVGLYKVYSRPTPFHNVRASQLTCLLGTNHSMLCMPHKRHD